MKIIRPTIILSSIFFQSLALFSQKNTVLPYLPSDAKMIIKINSGSLRQKIKWEEVMQSKMFEDLTKEAPGEGKDLLNDPSQSGIDISQGFFVVITENKNGGKTEPTFYGTLKDTARFRAMVKKLSPEN